MEGNVLIIIWAFAILAAFATCWAVSIKFRFWPIFACIAIVAIFTLASFDVPFIGAAPFSNKFADVASRVSNVEMIFGWYLQGLSCSAGAFTGAYLVGKKQEQPDKT